jgi:predicted GNAT superfamily acetyltransferase
MVETWRGYTIRSFETIDEFRECVDLQEETWGQGFSERVPPAILKVSQILGGVSAGAYAADGDLVGFVFGMTGLRGGEIVHWSDMLAVREEARDSGLGTKLKAYQRDRVMELGVKRMHWTFDPLQSRNAYLNFAKLGIVVREYARDMYGQTDSPLHRGIGTDRMIPLWLLESERVTRRLEGTEVFTISDVDSIPYALRGNGSSEDPAPLDPVLNIDSDRLLVSIPSDVAGMLDRSAELALEWRLATRTVFTHYLAAGYEARELLRADHTSDYLLAKIQAEE